MKINELTISGAFEITPKRFSDSRGFFVERFKQSIFSSNTGRLFSFDQVNTSISNRGVVRGIHYADTPPGQAKYVSCMYGRAVDFIVDIREGSPTFGCYESVVLDSTDCNSVFLSEGLGHCFLSLEDNSVVTYFCSTEYNPTAEHGVNPLCSVLALDFGTHYSGDYVISEKDRNAPDLAAAMKMGILPDFDRCMQFYKNARTLQGDK